MGGRGTSTIGPDLTGLASKYDRAELIRSVLEPSSRIAIGYQPVIVATSEGKVHSGVVRAETEAELELADSDAKITRIPKSKIEERRVGEVSIMPARLVETLSPVDFADLISFLASLKQSSTLTATPSPNPEAVSRSSPTRERNRCMARFRPHYTRPSTIRDNSSFFDPCVDPAQGRPEIIRQRRKGKKLPLG